MGVRHEPRAGEVINAFVQDTYAYSTENVRKETDE